ncbi:MAG TPA: GGDEF domain-containing phosphodiesterase [Alphaproteobacteria bacterium]|nr:GGDEF domain-containing phosphodiesterase [Alphaproteobacteria bacterium]
MTLYDPLTGLPDRALFGDRLRHSMARADRRKGALAVLVVDPGARGDDEAIRAAGAALTERVRATDTVARFDERRFAVIQTDLDRFDEAAFLAQKLLDGLGPAAGVGIALYPDDSREPEVLAGLAGGALDAARERGAAFAYHARAVTAEAEDRVGLARDLRGALKAGELRMRYQPKLDIASGRIVGAEALMRWEHPERGTLAPDAFLGVARESEMIVPLGEWALGQACRDAASWPTRTIGASGDGPPPGVAVNVEAEQFEAADFARHIAAALDEAGLSPSRLEIEITESSLMRDPEQVADTLIGLAKLGVSITVDDFGTGYSSLAYLRRFPVDALKIDRAFVDELPDNAEDAAIVRAIVSLAAALNLRVVAEGVSRQNQLDFLAAEGCQLAQGYLIGEAMTSEDFAALLKSG